MSEATVLVVDDEPRYVRWISLNLRGAGYRVLEAGDGPGAVDSTAQHQPDLLLLDMSRIESGSLRVDPHPTELARLLEASGARLRVREPHRQLTVDVPTGLPSVLADEQRIAQVLDNLLTNAARYSPAEARIGLRARAANGSVEVAVQDCGPGVPEDKREQVFDKFVRLDDQPGGSGLGLAICRGIVQAHGGRIWVESELGRGTAVHFTIPTVGGPDGSHS